MGVVSDDDVIHLFAEPKISPKLYTHDYDDVFDLFYEEVGWSYPILAHSAHQPLLPPPRRHLSGPTTPKLHPLGTRVSSDNGAWSLE